MTNRVVNTVLALALLGACALGQDQGHSRTVASVSDMPADNAPSATSLRQGFESSDRSPVAINQSSPYYWKTTPVGDSAQLLTLLSVRHQLPGRRETAYRRGNQLSAPGAGFE
jgi:hypothetical protein